MSTPKLHLICNAHLDPVWQWQWEEGCAEALSTFNTAVQILKENDELIFNHNEAVLYRWVQKYNPVLFKEIQKLVEDGRWCISGGWHLQPDVNLPGIESIIRNIIEGRKFFKEYFNAEPKVAYNFDSFGHSGGLPQILNLAGYKMYIHMRPHHPELILPASIYKWRGVDGSEILSYRIEVGLYHTEYENIEQRLSEGTGLAIKLNRDVAVFWGIGDHGGGAIREDLKKINNFKEHENRVEIIHSTTEKFFEAILPLANYAPVVEGDLQKIFTGCYTSLSRVKRGANKNLARLLQSEKLATAAWWIGNHNYPNEKFEVLWRDHIFNDFHDILPGSCIEPAENDAINLYGKISEELKRINLKSAISFNGADYQNLYLPLTVMNSNASLTNVPVEVECMISYRPKWEGKWHLKLTDLNGNEVICQEEQPEALLPFNGWRRKISFVTNLHSIGIKNFKIEAVRGEVNQQEVKPTLTFTFDKVKGLVNRIIINQNNFLIGNLLEPIVVNDEADSWGTNYNGYHTEAGRFTLVPDSFRVIEKGPVRTITESIFQYNASKIIYHVIGYSELDILEYKIKVHWNEERKRLKLSVPTIFENEKILCEVPGGAIERIADGEEQVNGRWIMVSGKLDNENVGLAVVHNGQHGYDFKNGKIKLSILRSAAYCHEQGFKIEEFPYRKFSDIGVHDIHLIIKAGAKDEVMNSLAGLAEFVSAPPVAYSHLPVGKAALEENLVGFSNPAVQVLTAKKSFENEALILRLQNSLNQISAAGIEMKLPAIKFNLAFKPYEIKTICITKDGNWKEVNIITEE